MVAVRLLLAGLVVFVVACGSDSLTVVEYAEEVEDLVGEMVAGFAAIDAE